MKNLFALVSLLAFSTMSAQQHFAGMNTSSRGGIINGTLNPAELANFTSKYDVILFAPSVIASNNKIGFSELVGGDQLEEKLFSGQETVNLHIDGEILGPGFAFGYNKWTFAFTTKASVRFDLVDVDPNIGDAIVNGGLNSLVNTTTLNNDYNQRMNGTSWGEVGVSVARNLYDDGTHRFGAGVTLKVLFPGSYANFGANDFSGTINYTLGDVELTDATANLNIAYSGNLGESFDESSDYFKSLFGKPNGFAADLGVNYQWHDTEPGKYRINAGFAIRNLGQMTFSDTNNASTNYSLNIPSTDALNLNQFEDISSLEEVEQILLESGFLNRTQNNSTDFKVKLPTTFTAYADIKLIPTIYATVFTQQRMKKNDENDQIAVENVTSVTPRFLIKNVELYAPLSINEISGFSAGAGFRAYGLYIGSSSIITALTSDSKQADLYVGFSFRVD
jgi:hypothetical protein